MATMVERPPPPHRVAVRRPEVGVGEEFMSLAPPKAVAGKPQSMA
jgi:hypothetical protein